MLSPSENMVVLDSVVLEKATIYYLEGDIIKIQFADDIEMDLGDIMKLQEPKSRLVQGKHYFLLVNAPRHAYVSKEAREFSATPEANKGAIAKAIITTSLSMRLIANFFISVNKPPVPHRIFSNEQDALTWFNQLKNTLQEEATLSDSN